MLSKLLKNSKLKKHQYFPFVTSYAKKNNLNDISYYPLEINPIIDNNIKKKKKNINNIVNKKKSFLDIPDGTYIH